MGNKQLYPVISNISSAIWKICRHNRKEKGLFTWNSSFYNFNLSYYFLAQHHFSDNFKDIPGSVKCNDLWYKPGNYYIGISARRTWKGNGNQYHSVYLGLSCGPVIGGLLTQYFGWRSIFAFLVPFGIISLILINRRIKTEWADASGESFDWRGAVIYGIALSSFMYGFSRLPSATGWIFIIVGLIMAIIVPFCREKDH